MTITFMIKSEESGIDNYFICELALINQHIQYSAVYLDLFVRSDYKGMLLKEIFFYRQSKAGRLEFRLRHMLPTNIFDV